MVRRRATPSASPTPPVRLVPETGTCEPFPAAVRKMFALAAMVSRSWFCWALIPYTTIRVNPNFDHRPPLIFFFSRVFIRQSFTDAWGQTLDGQRYYEGADLWVAVVLDHQM